MTRSHRLHLRIQLYRAATAALTGLCSGAANAIVTHLLTH
jgi:hypothetical protein